MCSCLCLSGGHATGLVNVADVARVGGGCQGGGMASGLKRRFLLSITVILILLNCGMSLLVYRTNLDQYEARQAEIRLVQEAELAAVFARGLDSIVALTTFIPELRTGASRDGVSPGLAERFSAVMREHGLLLNVEWGVEGVHVFDRPSDADAAFSWPPARAVPDSRALVQRAHTADTPVGTIVCEERCWQVAAMPLMHAGSTTAVVIVERSIGDSLRDFHQLSGADVVLVDLSDTSHDGIPGHRLLGTSQAHAVSAVVETLAALDHAGPHDTGAQRVSVADQWYEVFRAQGVQTDPSVGVMIVDRVTEQVGAIHAATRDSLLLGFVGLVLSEILMAAVFWGPVRRLGDAVAALPLLADKSFESLRAALPRPASQVARDEIDSMVLTLLDVADRIEGLDATKRAVDEALRASERNLQMAQSMARVASWTGRPLTGEIAFGDGVLDICPALSRIDQWTGFTALIHPEDRVSVVKAWHAARAGDRIDICFRLLAEQQPLNVHMVARLDAAGPDRTLRATGMIQDVTLGHEVQYSLRAQRDSMEHEVLQRIGDLVAARKQAERLAKTRADFVAHMSHEMRTPLNAMLGLSQIGRDSSHNRRIAATFDQILDAGRYLMNVVDGVLDLAKIEAGKLVIDARPFDLRPTLHQAMEMLATRAAAKGLSLQLTIADDVDGWVVGDEFRLQQILLNLLGNAVKFTEHGRVSLQVEREADQHRFCVSDTGIGMSKSQIAQLFTPYFQAAERPGDSSRGAGLGLDISRRLAVSMGGDIRVRSNTGQGSEFTLVLPLPDADPGECVCEGGRRVSPGEPQQPLEGLDVTVVDDVQINRSLVVHLLEQSGARVRAFDSGRAVVEALCATPRPPCDVVLMDVQMPGLDGRAATHAIRAAGIRTPVIGLTAYATEADRHASLAAGMQDQLVKPVMRERLVQKILAVTGGAAPAEPNGSDRADGRYVLH